MGNKLARCPQGFQSSPSAVFKCVYSCPENKGFILQSDNGNPHCVYKNNVQYKLPLVQADAVFLDNTDNTPLTLERVRQINQDIYNQYKTAKDGFNRDFPVLYESIDKELKIADAFKALQEAENARDQSPEAYQEARVRYYTLVKGDTWKDEEKERIAKAEVEPAVSRFQQLRDQAMNQIRQQQVTKDVVTGVKDKVVNLRDELKYSVDTFGKQIQDIKNQIHVQNRVRLTEKEKTDPTEWIDWILNILIVVLLGAGIFLVFTRLRRRQQTAYTLIPVSSNAAV
jgi:hypothetical protein